MNKKNNRLIQSETVNKIATELLNFSGIKMPEPVEQLGTFTDKYRPCGVDNKLPYFFLSLYNSSSTHAAIIRAKVNYIIGDGLKFKDGSELKGMANANDSFTELVRKIVMDYEIFNRFAVKVTYNSLKQPIAYHCVPVWQVRFNDDRTKFWVNDNWKTSMKATVYNKWSPNPLDDSSKIFYYDNYVPSESIHYTLPEYYPCCTAIMADSQIDKFTLNNLDSHFSVSSLISFYMGANISDADKGKINNDIKSAYTGATGKKIMVNYQSPDSKEPTVQNIASNDWADVFAETGQRTKETIITGHEVPYMLVGIPVAGKLGGGNEKEGDMFRFKNFYIRNRRNQLLDGFTQLFAGSELEFTDVNIATELTDELKEKIFTLNEIRKERNMPALEGGDVLLSKYQGAFVPSTEPVQPQSKFSSEGFNLSEEDFDKIKDFGVTADEFEFIGEGEFVKSQQDFRSIQLQFETMDEIAQYLLDNEIESTDLKTLKTEIRRELGINVTSNELKNMLADISSSGISNVEVDGDGNIKVTKPQEPKRTFEVMYSYDVRPGYGQPIEDNTRPFCKKLIENNRFYTTEEIQTMTSIFGYDIFQYGGGWYRDPETQKLTSHCRHYFKANTVTRRKK
ncbi:MAG: hypothetical protein QM737_02720 [Ferruginibacter sp.]